MKLTGEKVAVITGGARRIGRSIAVHLHALGFDIALHYRKSQHSAEALAQELCTARDGSCQVFQADIGNQTQRDALVTELLSHYGCIDLLVNNASGFAPTPIEHCAPDEFDRMLDSNLKAPYFLIQGLLPAIRAVRGSVVNIIDIHAERPLPNFNVYCASKAGLASLTRSLAVELAPQIRVNGVAPGAILWPEEDEGYDASMRDRTISMTPLARLGDPEDVARAVGFLACDAPFITGQVIAVDGGRSLVS